MHDEVGNEPSASGHMSQVLLCFKFLLFAFQLLSRKLCSLSLYLCNAKVLGSKGVDVSYHPWVS